MRPRLARPACTRAWVLVLRCGWLHVPPHSPRLSRICICNVIAVTFEGEDSHGHASLTDNRWGRFNIRHIRAVAGWRQVLVEAGASIPDRNVERMLSRTNIPVAPEDTRRLDLVAPGLNVCRGLPLFCDVTVLSPISAAGIARPGTSNQGGQLLRHAEEDNNDPYGDVIRSGLGELLCLGSEVYGRWSRGFPDLKIEKLVGFTKFPFHGFL